MTIYGQVLTISFSAVALIDMFTENTNQNGVLSSTTVYKYQQQYVFPKVNSTKRATTELVV